MNTDDIKRLLAVLVLSFVIALDVILFIVTVWLWSVNMWWSAGWFAFWFFIVNPTRRILRGYTKLASNI